MKNFADCNNMLFKNMADTGVKGIKRVKRENISSKIHIKERVMLLESRKISNFAALFSIPV